MGWKLVIVSQDTKEELEKRLKDLETERKLIKSKLREILAGEKIESTFSDLKSQKHLLFVFEKKSCEGQCLVRAEYLSNKEISINSVDFEYIRTVERTGRNGLDSACTSWSEIEEDYCEFCPDEDNDPPTVHGLSFRLENLPKEIDVRLQFDLKPGIGSHGVVKEWEHGSEYERGHVCVSDLVCVMRRETLKLIEDNWKGEER